jgi:peroxiredoxin
MKKSGKILIAVLFILGLGAGYAFKNISTSPAEILEIGAKAPKTDVKMADVSGKTLSLDELKKKNGLLVIFSCNTCPFVVGNGSKSQGWEGRYPELADMTAKNEIGFALINSNEAKRDAGDSMDDMKKRYKEKGLKGNYLLDKNHAVADAFGALTTPHVFLFDGNMKLIYKGAIDDSVDSKDNVKEAYLENAVKAHVGGKTIDPNSTRQMGCSIKRVKV